MADIDEAENKAREAAGDLRLAKIVLTEAVLNTHHANRDGVVTINLNALRRSLRLDADQKLFRDLLC